MLRGFVLILFGAAAAPAGAAELLVREFEGIGRTDTAAFTVEAPWLVEWWSRPPSAHDHKPAHLEIHLYDAVTNLYAGRVAQHAGVGNGNVLIERSGRFRFLVQGQATNWQVRVLQVDAEVAERLKEAQRERTAPKTGGFRPRL
jgi:hypothetical protein